MLTTEQINNLTTANLNALWHRPVRHPGLRPGGCADDGADERAGDGGPASITTVALAGLEPDQIKALVSSEVAALTTNQIQSFDRPTEGSGDGGPGDVQLVAGGGVDGDASGGLNTDQIRAIESDDCVR